MVNSRSIVSSAVAWLASASLVGNAAAQVHTDCNPMKQDCPANPAFGIAHNFVFNKTQPAWDTTVGPVTYDDENGATFTIAQQGESPTIRTQQYIFFGRIEIIMRAAKGRGIISSVMLLSDNLDEIDWEFLGINQTMALTNYFGKGSEDFTNGKEIVVPGENVQDSFHNYTLDWTQERLHWIIDGNIVRTLLPKDAKDGAVYPQTPCRISLGIWAGSDPRLPQGTRDWAGGETDFSEGPFSMHVKSTYIHDYHTGKEYLFGDRSGSWQSIKVVEGESPANKTITAAESVSPTIAERWASLSDGARTGIYIGAASFVAIIAGAFLFYCIRQRKRGQKEAQLAAEREKQEQLEMNQFRAAGIDPDSLVVQHAENPFTTPAQSISEKQHMHVSDVETGSGAAAAAAAPLLRNGPGSPRSPPPAGQYYDQPPNGYANPAGPGSPRSPPPAGHYYDQPQDNSGTGYAPAGSGSPRSPSAYPERSATAPPVDRMNSPGPINGPQRSHTTDSRRDPGGSQGGNDPYWR